jgi:hypothetical protein
MATASETNRATKRRETVAKLNAKVKGVGEPTISFLTYKLDLIQALNWYNIYATNTEKKIWALAYITDHKQKVLLNKVDESSFRQVGTLARLISNDQYLDSNELAFMNNKFKELLNSVVSTKTKSAPKKASNQDKYKDELSTFIADIDEEIDIFIKQGYPKNFSFKTSAKSITGQAAKLVPSVYKAQIDELQETINGTCEQLNEGYGHLKSTQIKSYLKLLKDLVMSCSQQVVSVKKPTVTKKPKSPAVAVKLLKFLAKFDELKLVSEKPVKIVDCQEVWLYDTVKRKLQMYKAVKGSKISVSRSSIVGFDIEASCSKAIRKPELLVEYAKLGKRELGKLFQDMKSKAHSVTGRTNENVIILKVFA